MQRSVFEGWVRGLNERGFDLPLLALLRSHGYYDIHFTHGAYEFGKDFIAKRVEGGVTVQFAIQSKAGDIAGSEWDTMFSQLYEASGGTLTHPNFDPNLPRACRLVTTGRLKGKAIQSAGAFRAQLQASGISFAIWDCDSLLDLARGTHPDFPLRDMHPAVEQIVAEMELGTLGSRQLLLGLERAVPGVPLAAADLYRVSLEATLVIAALRRKGLLLHVPLVAAHLARVALAASSPTDAAEAYEEAAGMFRAATDELIAMFDARIGSDTDLLHQIGGSLEVWVTLPVTSVLLGEFAAISLLHAIRVGDVVGAARCGDFLRRLVSGCGATSRPVSDRFASSTFAMCAGLAALNEDNLLRRLLTDSTVWLCDRYAGDEPGLAGPYASPEEEVRYFLGASLACTDVVPRDSSLLAVALIEGSSAWAPELYPDVLNDVLAVEACPTAVIPIAIPEALFLRGGGTQALISPNYPPQPGPLPWHQMAAMPAAANDAMEAPFLLASACRDRLFQGAAFRVLAAHVSPKPPASVGTATPI